MTTQAEKEAAKAAKLAEKEAAKAASSAEDIIVGDPLVLRPVELPLVVKPGEGKTWTPEQQEYVNVINAYAYKNPKKWAKKKDLLIARLREIGENPEKLLEYKGGPEGGLSFKNKIIEQ